MKKVNLTSLNDLNTLSWVLDQALYLLANSPIQLRPSQLCQVTGLPSPMLSRMRHVHVNSQYEPFVNQHTLIILLRFLLQQFPTLILAQNRDGEIFVRLYNTHDGYKLLPLHPLPSAEPLFRRNRPKPGTTRWFLEQALEEKPSDERGGNSG